MASSWYQTCDVRFPNSHMEFHTILPRPVAPPEVKQEIKQLGMPEGIRTGDKCIVWDPSGEVYVHEADGRSAYFHKRPTLKSAIKCTYGAYFQFHPDGSATVKANGNTYYYSPRVEMEAPTEWTWLAKKWDPEQETYLFEGIDYEPEDELAPESDIDADAGSGSDSDDGGPRCCRGCWRKQLPPDVLEEYEIAEAASGRKVFNEFFKPIWEKGAAEGCETSKEVLARAAKNEQAELARKAAFEAKKAAAAAAGAASTHSMDTEGGQHAYT